MDSKLDLVAVVISGDAGILDGGVATLDRQRFCSFRVVGERYGVIVLKPVGYQHMRRGRRHRGDDVDANLRVDVGAGEIVRLADCHLVFSHVFDG